MMEWTPTQVFILLYLLAAYVVVFLLFLINGGEKMFNWLITMFAPLKPGPKRCIDCGNLGVLKACGRHWCRVGELFYFPDKGDECPSFLRGDNPVSRGEI
jgi:hypothetical protein